jgi:hypothetical protein
MGLRVIASAGSVFDLWWRIEREEGRKREEAGRAFQL